MLEAFLTFLPLPLTVAGFIWLMRYKPKAAKEPEINYSERMQAMDRRMGIYPEERSTRRVVDADKNG